MVLHYVEKNLDILFEYNGKRIVMLIIPASKSVKTKFNGVDYIRIGSSKEKLNKFPEYEIRLNNILLNGFPTIVNMPVPTTAPIPKIIKSNIPRVFLSSDFSAVCKNSSAVFIFAMLLIISLIFICFLAFDFSFLFVSVCKVNNHTHNNPN